MNETTKTEGADSPDGASNESLNRGPRLEVSIDKRGGSVSATGASIASSRVVGFFDGPSGGVTESVNPRSFCAVNLVVDEQSGFRVSGNSDIPVGVGVSWKPLHVRINLGDDFGVGHVVNLELLISSANAKGELPLPANEAPRNQKIRCGG